MRKFTTLFFAVFISMTIWGQNKVGSTGYIGIGTTQPVKKLHLQDGTFRIQGTSYLGNWIEMVSTHYSPNQYWKWWIESDGLKLSRSNDGQTWTKLLRFDDVASIMELDFSNIRLNGKVGIGTNFPSTSLEVKGALTYSLNEDCKTIVHTNKDGNSYFNYVGGSASSRIGFQIDGQSKVSIMSDGNVGIGTTTPSAKLDVAGTIRATEIKVEAQTADFVFEDNYPLRTLDEVEAFIKTRRHLPSIPSSVYMEKNGVNLAEMNKLLLQKIEELTLYAIEQERKLKEKDRVVEELKAESNRQKSEIINQKTDIEAMKNELSEIKAFLMNR